MTAHRFARSSRSLIPLAAVASALLAGTAVRAGQTAPAPDAKWLQQLVGEWTIDAKADAAPGQPAFQSTGGTETTRAVGGWIISELKSTFPMGPMTGIMTVGYDPEKKQFRGTFIDDHSDLMWHYRGWIDPTGKILTLEADGPNFADPKKTSKYRDVIEIKSKDHKVLTSSVLQDNGKWESFMTVNFRRKK